MKKTTLRWLAALLTAIMILALLGCGGSPAPAPKAEDKKTEDKKPAPKDPIKVGGIFDLTGPTSDVGVPFSGGITDYVKYVNSKGGVAGRQIDLIAIDYAYKVPQAVEAYKKLTTQDKVVAIFGWGTADTEALREFIAKDKIPYTSAAYSEALLDIAKSPYNFLFASSYSDQAAIALKWIKDNHKGGTPKVALVYNESPFGKSPIEDAKKFAKQLGITLVNDVVVPLQALDVTSQMVNMQKDNPDYAIVQNTSSPVATVLKDAKRLGIKTKFIGLNWAADEKLIKLAGDAAEGYMGIIQFAFPYENVPGLKEIKDYVASSGQKWEDKNQKYVAGWATGKIFVEGIRRAAEKGPVNGESIKAAMETMKDYDLNGLGPSVTFTAQSHRGTAKARLGTVKDGKFIMTDYITAPGR